MILKQVLNEQFPGWYTKNKQVLALLETEVLTTEINSHCATIKLNKQQRFEKANLNVFVTVNHDGRVCKNF